MRLAASCVGVAGITRKAVEWVKANGALRCVVCQQVASELWRQAPEVVNISTQDDPKIRMTSHRIFWLAPKLGMVQLHWTCPRVSAKSGTRSRRVPTRL